MAKKSKKKKQDQSEGIKTVGKVTQPKSVKNTTIEYAKAIGTALLIALTAPRLPSASRSAAPH